MSNFASKVFYMASTARILYIPPALAVASLVWIAYRSIAKSTLSGKATENDDEETSGKEDNILAQDGIAITVFWVFRLLGVIALLFLQVIYLYRGHVTREDWSLLLVYVGRVL